MMGLKLNFVVDQYTKRLIPGILFMGVDSMGVDSLLLVALFTINNRYGSHKVVKIILTV